MNTFDMKLISRNYAVAGHNSQGYSPARSGWVEIPCNSIPPHDTPQLIASKYSHWYANYTAEEIGNEYCQSIADYLNHKPGEPYSALVRKYGWGE